MDYPKGEDFIYVPVKPTHVQLRLADLIYNFTGVNRERLINCICRYGIYEVLNNPDVLCVPIAEQQKINELMELLFYIKETK